jgi:hypothetical protein
MEKEKLQRESVFITDSDLAKVEGAPKTFQWNFPQHPKEYENVIEFFLRIQVN